MSDYFLTNVNRTIGENMRFARNFTPNQNPTSSQAAPPPPAPAAPQPIDIFNSMIPSMMMLVLFQMMTQLAGQMGSMGGAMGGAGAGAAAPYYPPLLPQAPSPVAPTPAPPTNNVAVDYLDQLLAEKIPNVQGVITLEDADVAKVRADVQSGEIPANQLGQALKYMLDTAPDEEMPAVSQLIAALTTTGELTPGPFLQNAYLEQLSDQRFDMLLNSLEMAGLNMVDGQPNSRFIGFILDNLGRADQPQTQLFLQNFLQDYQDTHGQAPETAAGRTLNQVLTLANLTPDASGNLNFAAVTASPTTPATSTPTTSTPATTTPATTTPATDTTPEATVTEPAPATDTTPVADTAPAADAPLATDSTVAAEAIAAETPVDELAGEDVAFIELTDDTVV